MKQLTRYERDLLVDPSYRDKMRDTTGQICLGAYGNLIPGLPFKEVPSDGYGPFANKQHLRWMMQSHR
jgi:hypothetical protein